MTTAGELRHGAAPGSLRDQGIVGEEGPRQVDVAAEGVPLGALDEDDDLLDRLEVEDERVDDGVDRGQLRGGAVGELVGDVPAEVDRGQAVLGDEDLAHLGLGRERREEALLRAPDELGQGPLGLVGLGRPGGDLARLLVERVVVVGDEEERHGLRGRGAAAAVSGGLGMLASTKRLTFSPPPPVKKTMARTMQDEGQAAEDERLRGDRAFPFLRGHGSLLRELQEAGQPAVDGLGDLGLVVLGGQLLLLVGIGDEGRLDQDGRAGDAPQDLEGGLLDAAVAQARAWNRARSGRTRPGGCSP
ncbi:MAG: hypothetical protein MZV63_64700 [Marinilabiliales bacterium]|nr:hypothetical protein [Marinilabiliales bacterium]